MHIYDIWTSTQLSLIILFFSLYFLWGKWYQKERAIMSKNIFSIKIFFTTAKRLRTQWKLTTFFKKKETDGLWQVCLSFGFINFIEIGCSFLWLECNHRNLTQLSQNEDYKSTNVNSQLSWKMAISCHAQSCE